MSMARGQVGEQSSVLLTSGLVPYEALLKAYYMGVIGANVFPDQISLGEVLSRAGQLPSLQDLPGP